MDFAIRHKAKGGAKELKPEDLIKEFNSYAADGYAVVWDLSNHMITPGVLTNLFTKIAESGVELKGGFGPSVLDVDCCIKFLCSKLKR